MGVRSAVLFMPAFPPYGFWPLIFFLGLVSMVEAQHREMMPETGLANGWPGRRRRGLPPALRKLAKRIWEGWG